MCTGFPLPRSHITWMLSQENIISFSWTLGCSVFRELNVKAPSLSACTAVLEHSHSFHRVREDICTALASNGERTKWILQSEGFAAHWNGTQLGSQSHRKGNTDTVCVWIYKDELMWKHSTFTKSLLYVEQTYIISCCVFIIFCISILVFIFIIFCILLQFTKMFPKNVPIFTLLHVIFLYNSILVQFYVQTMFPCSYCIV